MLRHLSRRGERMIMQFQGGISCGCDMATHQPSRILILSASAALFASIACRTDAVPEELWVPERATELKVARGTVGYTVQETYPANRVREELERKLGAKGYKRLNRDALDPTGPELRPEWRSYIDGRNGGEQCTWEIVEDWQKADGGVIRLELRYVAPCGKPPAANVQPRTDTLRVNAIILGAADIERLRKSGRRDHGIVTGGN